MCNLLHIKLRTLDCGARQKAGVRCTRIYGCLRPRPQELQLLTKTSTQPPDVQRKHLGRTTSSWQAEQGTTPTGAFT